MPATRIVKVICPSVTHPGRSSMREPTEEEWPAINDYVRRYVEELGGVPYSEHEVPGVGDSGIVVFCLAQPDKFD